MHTRFAMWLVVLVALSPAALAAAAPPDVDAPKGIQEVLVSDPAAGWRSRSEPHLAQSPVDYRVMVGASKFYNRDPDSLPEYEFKVGTYASFDAGRTWADLGQLNTCPREQAPPSSWPHNTCYPEDDPAIGGSEDTGDPRGTGDYGEEYLTSDPWVRFDDEGNAYAMVLDSPPYPSGRGWGMSFHIWESVAAADVDSGQTWSDRIVINAYEAGDDALFLDDKNTFAVNNAGPDLDGRVGIIVACWTQTVYAEDRQQIVCERSTDGGRSWPGTPLPISTGQRFVIGVHVVADPRDPETFHAVWLDRGVEPEELSFSRSTDGGVSWSPPSLVTVVDNLPAAFPGNDFRNLTLPIMAAGPRGALYVVYSEYRRPAFDDPDADGKQADVMLVRASDGGSRWSEPLRVNRDRTNADQFQPYVDVTAAGQVNVNFFDRRHDPADFHIDNYLARSNDGGATFTEQRLSHDMWDPSINPPISSWGEFIGDYQGLVADTCSATPFMQDTHLANAPERDPDFDEGMPRSQFQQLFAWRVRNTAATAGRADDRLSGGGGRDRLCGLAGSDLLRGGAGDDVIRAGPGADRVRGGQGHDVCHLGLGPDDARGCEALTDTKR